jgi:hypothetical protein
VRRGHGQEKLTGREEEERRKVDAIARVARHGSSNGGGEWEERTAILDASFGPCPSYYPIPQVQMSPLYDIVSHSVVGI